VNVDTIVPYLTALLESTDDAILAKTLDGTITYWNPGAEILYGYPAEEIVGRSILLLIPPDRVPEFKSIMRLLKQGDRIQHFETVRVTRTGKRVDVSLTISPISDIVGELIGASTIAHDISERKAVEQKLAAAQEGAERALTQLENIAEGVLVTGPQGDFLLANPGFWRSYGLNPGSVDHIADLETILETANAAGKILSPEDGPFARALRGEILNKLEVQVRRKSGPTVAALVHSASPVYDKFGVLSMVVHTIDDITERKSLQERLMQAEKLEAIGQLAGGVAHDMNNYLGCVMLQVGLLRETVTENEEHAEYCSEIENVCEQARAMVRQLLSFGRRSNDMRVLVNVHNSCSATLIMLRRMIDRSIEIDFKFDEPGWSVDTSPGHLSAILMNLALNARDSMLGGGKLSILTKNVSIATPRLLHDDVVPPGDYIILTVRDTGSGIAPENMKKIFDPFFTTKSLTGGTGLGLSTVYGAVREMNGYLQVTSGASAGTTFEVWMPRSKHAEAESPRSELRTEVPSGAILVVEDEPSSHQALGADREKKYILESSARVDFRHRSSSSLASELAGI
jgi:PAS domain S-box-containing protein